MEPYNICPFGSAFFHSACFQNSSMLWHATTPFPFMAEYYFTVWLHHILSIGSSVGGRWGCFHPLATVNKSAKNTVTQVSVRAPAFSSLGHMPGEKLLGGKKKPSCVSPLFCYSTLTIRATKVGGFPTPSDSQAPGGCPTI